MRKLTGKALWVLKIFLCVFASAVFLCACAGGRGEPAAFDPASLTWGMTEEEALEALGLSEGDVTVEEEAIPAENVTAPKTLRTMNGPDMVYGETPIRLRLVFRKMEGDPAYDLGLSRVYVDIREDDPNAESALKEALSETLEAGALRWEELSPQQQEGMKAYYSSSYPGSTGFGTLEMLGINCVGGSSAGDGTDGVYYTISWDGQNMAAWNRYVREAS